MRRRILISTLLTVALTALFLGGPLALATWQLVEDFTRAELTQRLEQVTETVEEYGTGWSSCRRTPPRSSTAWTGSTTR